ncbi:MAG: nucleotidyltransferase domain-containing protein [Proteobacteria bacterium]|nr:nucleotidyltransferase domain-containing protein [Pseudomonadota bacterium]
MVKREIKKIIKKFAGALKKEGIDIDKIVLYGSHANGWPRRDSDIDLAVVSRNFGKDRFQEGVFLLKIAGQIDSRLEPIPLSQKSYQRDTWVPLIYAIRQDGIDVAF